MQVMSQNLESTTPVRVDVQDVTQWTALQELVQLGKACTIKRESLRMVQLQWLMTTTFERRFLNHKSKLLKAILQLECQ